MPSSHNTLGNNKLITRLLRIYLYYRLTLALLLLALFALDLSPDIVGSHSPTLFAAAAGGYSALALLTLLASRHRRLTHPAALFFILLTDIIAHTLMMHASGGLHSGFGYLMLVTVAAGSIFFSGQLAILVAAIASICIILESVTTALLVMQAPDTIFPAGILGLLLFITSLIFQGLSRALRTAQELAARESEQSAQLQELNQIIVSRMLTGIVVIDGQDNIELINGAAVELLGGHRPGVPLASGQNLRVERELYRQLERWRSYPWLRTPPFTPKSGTTEIQANFTHLDQGGTNRTFIFLEDLRAAAQQAQQLKLASLGRLTGSIAHEIRNPLGAISHAAQLLGEQADGNDARLTGIIDKHSRRINHIIENILELSRQRSNVLQKLNLGDWLKRFIADYRDSVPDADIELMADTPAVQVSFDPSHLQQILTNLLDNAIRHSRDGCGQPWAALRVSVSRVDDLPLLDVLDRGGGVPEEHRGKLFEPFFTTSGEGSGLGLYIARELCEINFATLRYLPPQNDRPGSFRVGFSHPDKLLPRKEHDETTGTDHR